MSELFHLKTTRIIDSNGIADGATLSFYISGTLTPTPVYTSEDLSTEHPNPLTVAAGAAVPDIYLASDVAYRCIVKNSSGATIDDIDPYLGLSSLGVLFTQAGTGAVARTAQGKLREVISAEDFGAVADATGLPGGGTDNTVALQAAIDYCISTGSKLSLKGRYRTTTALVIDRSFNTADPINGGMYGISLRGGGPASAQIVADHDGPCIDFRGGADAGWHTFFYIDGVGILKAARDQAAGSIGLKLDQVAIAEVRRFDIYGFEHGIKGTDVLTTRFEVGRIAGNDHGFHFERGTRSHPNSITFSGVFTLNNFITGGTVLQPSVFTYAFGSIESNGFTETVADPNCWGLKIVDAGTEGSIGANVQGAYIENNNGIADIWLYQSINTATHNINGCSFLRLSDTRYVTSNILFDAPGKSRVSVSGCGFKNIGSFVDSDLLPFIGGADSKVIDGGGNTFTDTTGGTVGLRPSVFAPIGTNHSLPYAALPSVSESINGIQYCTDGGGAGGPSLAVSDGTTWHQIVLGQYAGSVSSAGAALNLPRGWTCTRSFAGVYTVTHNLGAAANSYAVSAVAKGGPGSGSGAAVCCGYALSGSSFEIYFSDLAGTLVDTDFSFTLSMI